MGACPSCRGRLRSHITLFRALLAVHRRGAYAFCAGAAAPRFPDKPSEYQSQAEFVKWAKNTMCESDRESLMGDMTVARMQQEFARDPQRVPLVHNKVGPRLCTHAVFRLVRTFFNTSFTSNAMAW